MPFGRLERRRAAPPMSEINMTPLIDVMLVLLVIFIITAPLIGSSLKLDLPTSPAAQPNDAPAFVALALDAEGRAYLDERPLDDAALAARLAEAAARDPATEVQLRADRRVPYGRVAELIGLAQQAGLARIGFLVEAPAPAPAAR